VTAAAREKFVVRYIQSNITTTYCVLGGVSVFKYAYVALASAALSVVVSYAADAQQAPLTSGGDVTAEEAMPLPPVVVESPAEPVTQQRSKGKVAGPTSATPGPATAVPAEQPGVGSGVPGVGLYTLGQLDMTAAAQSLTRRCGPSTRAASIRR
jgi:hypothetical protein